MCLYSEYSTYRLKDGPLQDTVLHKYVPTGLCTPVLICIVIIEAAPLLTYPAIIDLCHKL